MKFKQKLHLVREVIKSRIFRKILLYTLLSYIIVPILGYIIYFLSSTSENRTSPLLAWFFLTYLLLGLISGFIIAVIISMFFANRILLIKSKAEKMVQLKFDEDIQKIGEDEIGDLGIILNNLSSTLSSTLTILDEQNRELLLQVAKEKELEKERADFIAAISHELKTPIAVIKGQTEGMLYQVGKFKNRDEYLKKNLVVLDNMNNLVMEMIEINRLNTITKIDYEKINLSKILDDQISRINVLIEDKKQILKLKIEKDINVFGDKKFIERALNNILMNANKYSPLGAEIRINFRAEVESYLLNIENTGVHIPSDVISKLFNQFSRVEKSGNKETGGSGIGLYVVKKIFDLHEYQYQMHNTIDGIEFNLKIDREGNEKLEAGLSLKASESTIEIDSENQVH